MMIPSESSTLAFNVNDSPRGCFQGFLHFHLILFPSTAGVRRWDERQQCQPARSELQRPVLQHGHEQSRVDSPAWSTQGACGRPGGQALLGGTCFHLAGTEAPSSPARSASCGFRFCCPAFALPLLCLIVGCLLRASSGRGLLDVLEIMSRVLSTYLPVSVSVAPNHRARPMIIWLIFENFLTLH